MKFIFSSPLTVEECRHKLKAKVEERAIYLFSTKPYYGKIGEQKIEVGCHMLVRRYSSAPMFYGELQSEGDSGSRLTGSFQIKWFVKIFITFWLSIVSLAFNPLAAILKAYYLSGQQMDALTMEILEPMGFVPLACIGILILYKVNGKINEKAMIRFLTSTLHVNHTEQIDEPLFSKLDWACIGIVGAVMLVALLTGLAGYTLD